MVWLLPSLPSQAQEDPATAKIPVQIISLKDGSLIRGRLIGVENGSYIIQTEHLGEIKLNPDDINNLATNAPSSPAAQIKTLQSSTGELVVPQSGSTDALKAVQETLLTDPKLFSLLQELMMDPEVVQIIQNSSLQQDLMTMDAEKIQNNADFQKLLQHPKIQKIIRTFESEHLSPSQ